MKIESSVFSYKDNNLKMFNDLVRSLRKEIKANRLTLTSVDQQRDTVPQYFHNEPTQYLTGRTSWTLRFQ